MNVDLQIRLIGEEKNGISRTTGKPWKKRSFILVWFEAPIPGSRAAQQEQTISVDVFNERLDAMMAMMPRVGSWINADVEFTTTMFNNSVGNSVELWNISAINPLEQKNN